MIRANRPQRIIFGLLFMFCMAQVIESVKIIDILSGKRAL
jgi:hypothetical protein